MMEVLLMSSAKDSNKKDQNIRKIKQAYKSIKENATKELIANREQNKPLKKMSAELESIRF